MAINFALLNPNAPAEIGATVGNALAMRRQRMLQDEQLAQQREQQQVQNALAQMQLQRAQTEMDESAAFRASAGGLPADATSVTPEMVRASPRLAMEHQKLLTDQQKAILDMRSKMTDLQGKKIEMYRSQLPEIQTPEQMANWYVTQRNDPDLKGFSWPTTLDETLLTLRNASQSPQSFDEYRGKVAQGMEGFLAARKPAAPTELGRLIAERDALPQGDPRRATYDAAISKGTTHAPGTTVSVNTGQKGFENELKVRSDFRAEPVYKAHQEMSSAYSQIQQALKQASPAGDLAGATKIMKLLDPGSVVRESELGMAMAASGLLDRVTNYATNIINGTKLTPTQRADFQRLADALYSESVKAYNAKGSEYRRIAADYGMNADRIVGSPATAPASPGAGKSQYVETRRTADGRMLGKRADGTVEVIQ